MKINVLKLSNYLLQTITYYCFIWCLLACSLIHNTTCLQIQQLCSKHLPSLYLEEKNESENVVWNTIYFHCNSRAILINHTTQIYIRIKMCFSCLWFFTRALKKLVILYWNLILKQFHSSEPDFLTYLYVVPASSIRCVNALKSARASSLCPLFLCPMFHFN